MKRPNESELLYVEIPEELDAAILRGVQNGKRIMNRKKYADLRQTAPPFRLT